MADGVIDDVNDLSWFAAVLEESKVALDKYPPEGWPSWAREYMAAKQERGSSGND